MNRVGPTRWGGAWATLLIWGALAAHAQNAPAAAGVAIYYDGPAQTLAEGFLDARQIQNLLGHFGLAGEIFPVAEYAPGHLLGYRAAFFVGTAAGTRLPATFLDDVQRSPKPFCWIGRHVGALLATPEGRRSFGFSYIDYRDDLEFREVLYKGATLPKEDPDLNIVAVTDPAAVQILATAVNDEKQRHPYALRRGKFWYFADTPFSYVQEGDRYLVFCDLLHDILEVDHRSQSLALVRIEDVSADSDPADLRALGELLANYRVPFQIAVIPIFRDPPRGIEVRLSERPDVVDAIQALISRGGAPIMHGVTHQYRGTSADDYEFWDAARNRPIPGDSGDATLRKVGLGLGEMFSANIFPLAFETPHYAASEDGYRALQTVFTLFNERAMATPDIEAIQFFPYPVVDRLGRYVVPENLGYIEAGDPSPQTLIRRARNLLVVRDAIASFYFHSFLDRGLLAEVVRGISGLGYRFVPLRSFGGEVNFENRLLVRSAAGTARVAADDQYWRLRLYSGAGRLIEERFSRSRMSGTVSVPIQPPQGGWVVIDTVHQPQRQAPAPGPLARLWGWWNRGITGRGSSLGAARPALGQAWVLWLGEVAGESAANQRSYRTVLETFGFEVKEVLRERFLTAPPETGTILAIPEAAGKLLSDAQQNAVLNYISRGGLVLADGRQGWLSRLGYTWTDRRIPVADVTEVLFPEMLLRWQPEAQVERVRLPEGAQTLMIDAATRQPLASAGARGAGRYIHLAAALDPHSTLGASRYPYLFEYFTEAFRLTRPLGSSRLEVYFDPSYREGVGLERLASSWRQAGIRTIYAAAWKFLKTSSYDYAQLIRACHRNGISVYAWLILPAVTPRMWEEHPEWRERTASGSDGYPAWRPLLNLENPACFRAAMDWVSDLLKAYEWDGVNLTELNYDSDFHDYLRPDRFVPMNQEVRASFRKRSGVDPVEQFNPASPHYVKRDSRLLGEFLHYREDLVTDLHRRVLGELEPLVRPRGLEVVVTMLDSLHSDTVGPALGVDSRRIAALMKDFDFTLQVEDPVEHWRQPPDRYRRFAETYRRLVPDPRRLMFDINVVPDRSVEGTALPSSRATGTELALTVAAAASASGRAAIYAEHTVASQDWALIGAALARPARIQTVGGDWQLRSPIQVRLISYREGDYYLNGRLWPAVSTEGVTAPAGSYRVSFTRPWHKFLDRGELPARLLHINADLHAAEASSAGLSFRYSSPGRAVAMLNQRPLAVRVDEQLWEIKLEEGNGRWALVLPRGEHVVDVVTATRAGALLSLWSYVSSSTIALFGAVASALMIAIYLHLRWRRLRRRGGVA